MPVLRSSTSFRKLFLGSRNVRGCRETRAPEKHEVDSSDGSVNISVRTPNAPLRWSLARQCERGKHRCRDWDNQTRQSSRPPSEVDFSFRSVDGLTKVFIGIVGQFLPVIQRGSAITSTRYGNCFSLTYLRPLSRAGRRSAGLRTGPRH